MRQRRLPAASCGLCVVLLLALPVVVVRGAIDRAVSVAGDGTVPRARIERLRREAGRLATDLGRLRGSEVSVLDGLASLTAARDLASAEADAALRLTGELDAAVVRASAAAEIAAGRADAANEQLRRRLIALRRRGPAAGLAAVVTASDPRGALRTMRRLADGGALDREAALRAQRGRDEAATAAALLAARRVAAGTAQLRSVAATGRAATAMQQQQERLAEIREQESLHRRALAELDHATVELREFLDTRRSTEPAGPDPKALRGTLPWPAAGNVVIGFGPRRHARFGTSVPHNGVVIDAPHGSPVTAPAAGLVVFADWFQGYGRTVIVDHGSGVMTVCAHLAEIAVSQRDRVVSGGVLGGVGDSGTLDGTGLYFELREEGTPRSPLEWLTPFPAPR